MKELRKARQSDLLVQSVNDNLEGQKRDGKPIADVKKGKKGAQAGRPRKVVQQPRAGRPKLLTTASITTDSFHIDKDCAVLPTSEMLASRLETGYVDADVSDSWIPGEFVVKGEATPGVSRQPASSAH